MIFYLFYDKVNSLTLFVFLEIKRKFTFMRILHTADWHLGKKLDFFSRLEEQTAVMQEIVEITRRENVDLVLIAGDLFDSFNPPIEAVELFYKTLKSLSENGKRAVIAIAGNHDSPNRISAPDPLARSAGIILIGHPKAKVRDINMSGNFAIQKSEEGLIELIFHHIPYPVRLIHTAYANESRLKQYLDIENKETALNAALTEHWQNLADSFCDNTGVNLLMSHLYMLQKNTSGPEEPDGEKPLRLGNADLIYTDAIPKQIQYTALGHLHSYIPLGSGHQKINYSGSPLAYSFTEGERKKQVLIIDVKPSEKPTVEKVELNSGRTLTRKYFDNIPEAEEWLKIYPDTLVELSIESKEYLTAQDISTLRKAHDGIVHLIPIIKNKREEAKNIQKINLNDSIENIFEDYFKSRMGQAPNQEIKDLFKQLLS